MGMSANSPTQSDRVHRGSPSRSTVPAASVVPGDRRMVVVVEVAVPPGALLPRSAGSPTFGACSV